MDTGWVDACGLEEIEREDVIRFDHDARTYCLYRTGDDRYFATEGLCTHAKVHLSGGLVIGTTIECPKHNGRFDFVTGKAQGAPAVINLATYPTRVEGARLFVNL